MTKLRRLDPQPADLTTHEGPFVTDDGYPARSLMADYRDANKYAAVWVISSGDTDSLFVTALNGARAGTGQLIFAAEEIPEPRVRWMVYNPNGISYGSSRVEEVAKREAKEIGGTYAKFVEVLGTEDQ